MVGDLPAPLFVQAGVVVASVVDDHDNLSAAVLCDAFNPSIERPAGATIEHPIGRRHDEFAILQAHSTKITDALTSWGMKANRVTDFRWNPHATSGPVLLEMHLIHGPQVNGRISCHHAEFFYAWLEVPGRPLRPVGAVCVAENPVAEKVAGTGEPSEQRHAHAEYTPTRLGHPTSSSECQTPREWIVRLLRSFPFGVHSNDWDGPSAAPRTGQPARAPQSAGPSLRHCEVSLPAGWRHRGKSCREQRGGLHAVDDRNAKRHCAGSHPGEP